MFIAWVRLRRGAKLTDETDVFTGEVWTGGRAHSLGLVDTLGTMRGVLAERFPGSEVKTVGARRSPLARLGGASLSPADAVPALLEALEHRAAWSRFGR